MFEGKVFVLFKNKKVFRYFTKLHELHESLRESVWMMIKLEILLINSRNQWRSVVQKVYKLILLSESIDHDEFNGIKTFKNFSVLKNRLLYFFKISCHVLSLDECIPIVQVYHDYLIYFFT